MVRLGEERSRRVLITGLGTYWGGRLAQALELDRDIEAIIGVDNQDPSVELERTEFVRVGNQHALLRRIVEAAEIDTVIDTRLVVDSVTTSPRLAHENNVIGTMNILAAASGPDSSVRKLVFKSSAHYYGCEQDDPAFFTEQMRRPHPPRTPIERDIVEAEAAVEDFAEKNPDVTVTKLRCANVLGSEVTTSHMALFSLPAVPTIFGFDPRYQFVHEDDVVAALAHAVTFEVPGIYNVAGDGVLALSEVIDLLGRQFLPILPAWGTSLAVGPLRRLGLRIPPEMLNQLRFGRGLDNRRLKATGFVYRYTTRETVLALAEALRLRPILEGAREPYRYEREVEEFLRWSPYVTNQSYRRESRPLPGDVGALQRALAGYAAKSTSSAGRVAQSLADEPAAGGGAAAEEEEAIPPPPSDQPDPPAEPVAEEPDPPAEPVADEPVADEPVADDPDPLAEPVADEPEPAADDEEDDTVDSGEPSPNGADRLLFDSEPAPVAEYDELDAGEILSLLDSLEQEDLAAIREYEQANRSRPQVLAAIETRLARAEPRSP